MSGKPELDLTWEMYCFCFMERQGLQIFGPMLQAKLLSDFTHPEPALGPLFIAKVKLGLSLYTLYWSHSVPQGWVKNGLMW